MDIHPHDLMLPESVNKQLSIIVKYISKVASDENNQKLFNAAAEADNLLKDM